MKKIFFTFIIGIFTLAGCSFKTENPQQETASMQGNIETVNDEWNRYTNRELGFSIDYPSVNFLNGQEYNVKVIEDGNVIYISDGRYQEEIDQKKGLSDVERATGIPFAILIQDISNDEELENFIEERYGEKCTLGEKVASNQSGVFNVNVGGLGSLDDPESCHINYITNIKYSPEKGKVATWDIGQDANFYTKDGTPLDDQMTDSFKFL